MITKADAEAVMQQAGFTCSLDDGVLFFPGVDTRKRENEIRKKLREIGYRCSWGFARERKDDDSAITHGTEGTVEKVPRKRGKLHDRPA